MEEEVDYDALLAEDSGEIYESPGAGINAKLSHRELSVSPPELSDLLGPEEGQGYGSSESDGYLDYNSAVDMGAAMSMDGPPKSTASMQGMSAQDKTALRDLLAVRAQERLAASKYFQEKATAIGRPVGSGGGY